MENPQLLSPEEVAVLLRVDAKDVVSAIEAGELKALRLGEQIRIHEADYLSWVGPRQKTPSRRMLVNIVAMALVLAAGSAVGFELGQNESTRITNSIPRVLPFEGSYTLDGQGVDGDTPMSFALYEQGVGGAPVWTSSNRTVTVTDGRFAVALGDTHDATPIPESIFSSSALYLEVVAEGNALTPRQRLAPAPQAIAAARASTDFDVPDNATVGGTLGVSGKSTLSALDVNGNATFDANVTLGNAANDTTTVTGDLVVEGSLDAGQASISATSGDASFTDVSLENANVSGVVSVSASGVKMGLNGIYCGSTPPTTGKIVYPLGSAAPIETGYRAAKRLCEDACGTTTAHMCSSVDLGRSAQLGSLPNTSAWYTSFTLDLYESGTLGAQYTRDCDGWVTEDDNAGNRENFGPTFGFDASSPVFPNRDRCSTVQPIACCN